jgi:hypothetical protein
MATHTIRVSCEFCQREGRMLRYRYWTLGRYDGDPYEEIDCGECQECHGSCEIEVDTYPVEMEDLETCPIYPGTM